MKKSSPPPSFFILPPAHFSSLQIKGSTDVHEHTFTRSHTTFSKGKYQVKNYPYRSVCRKVGTCSPITRLKYLSHEGRWNNIQALVPKPNTYMHVHPCFWTDRGVYLAGDQSNEITCDYSYWSRVLGRAT